MTSRKLSDSDKQDILELYRQPGETTLTLASRYGVSSSTISRILKSNLSQKEYEALIQQKRSGRSSQNNAASSSEGTSREMPTSSPTRRGSSPSLRKDAPIDRRIRKRTTVGAEESDDDRHLGTQLELDSLWSDRDDDESIDRYSDSETSTLKEMLGEDVLDDDDLDDDDDDDLDDDDDDDEDLEEDYAEELRLRQRHDRPRNAFVEVIPLAEAQLPKICYLVIDRGAELITRPLKDFSELGNIPAQEVQEKTLPVFDNHRVARRFSARNQRVIKVPDGKMLQKTSSYLQEKGITRLLFDGQVYSL
ncbi:helix-turn-helix domain-containing protein [Oxynema sp. CENA135]|uniref:helix-turn-helix domain-containing protein n=1 Tax=Oxynema sp. CENA135 TaxID=984206 RepID=UPI00190E306F|nr:helix-turn-helix domain-containing protein [Oxynema sp. CENA135]MBK4730446.1 helix-turn-helix domain-containing protein [Oxynema sp. CENA135]